MDMLKIGRIFSAQSELSANYLYFQKWKVFSESLFISPSGK